MLFGPTFGKRFIPVSAQASGTCRVAVFLLAGVLSSGGAARGAGEAVQPATQPLVSAEQAAMLAEAHALSQRVVALCDRGNYADALAPALRDAELWRQAVGENDPDYAASLNNLATVYQKMGDFSRAALLLVKSAEIRKKALGANDPGYARCLNDLAMVYDHEGEYAKAEPLLRKAIEIRGRTLGKQNHLYGVSLSNLATVYEHMDDAGRAAPLRLEAKAIEARVERANALIQQVLQLCGQGRFAEAVPLASQAVQIRRQVLGEQHPEYGRGLSWLAFSYWHSGNYAEAEPLYRQAIEVLKHSLGEEHPDYATSLNNLAALYFDMGDYGDAELLYRRSMQITKQVLGERHPDYARSLNNLAALYKQTGDYAKAEPLFLQAVQIRKQALGEHHPGYAISLGGLAELYELMGDYARAEPLFRQAMQIDEQALGDQHPDYASDLNNLAALYERMGAYAKAEPLYRRAVQIKKQALGEQHPGYATSLNNLATLYDNMGDYAAAEPLLRETVQIMKRAVGEHHPSYATSLGNLAGLYYRTGDYAKAEPINLQVMQLTKEALGARHPEYARSLNNLACLYDAMGEHAKAAEWCGQALAVTRRNLELTAAVQSEGQQLRMQEMARRDLDAYLSFTQAARTPASLAYGPVLTWKGSVSQRQRQMRALRRLATGTAEPSGQTAGVAGADQARASALDRELEDASRTLATLMLATPSAAQTADPAWLRQRDQRVAELDQRVEALQQELAKLSEPYRTSLHAASVKEVIDALPPRAALIDVLEYSHGTPPTAGRGPMVSQRRLVAFVLRSGQGQSGQEVERVELGPAAPVAEAMERWRRTHGGGASGQAAGADLRKLIWDPLSSHLAGVNLLLVSPDGPLTQLPLGALPGAEPGHYLIEEMATAVAAVPQDLPRMLAAPAASGQESILLVGDVDYGTRAPSTGQKGSMDSTASAQSGLPQAAQPAAQAAEVPQHPMAARGRDGMTWPALAGTGPEVDLLRAEFQSVYGNRADKPVVLKGSYATVPAVCAAAPHCRYIHLATHGFFSPLEVRSASSPSTQPSGPFDAGDSRAAVIGFHPGLLSGVVLAGANHPSEADGDDGILTALEVSEMDLGHVDLATLSACETGLGQAAGGEGLLGLQRAFQVAGARSVVASLWSVGDAETQALMGRFYQNLWEKKMSKLEALRDAQLWMLNGGADAALAARRGLAYHPEPEAQPPGPKGRLSPEYWAAFVLSGVRGG